MSSRKAGYVSAVLVLLAGCGGTTGQEETGREARGGAAASGAEGVVFVGFDGSPPLVEAMREGKIQGLVLQNPYRMGYTGVKTLIDHLEDRAVEAEISTGETLATPENMDEPEAAELLNPPKIEHGADASLAGQKSKTWRVMVIPKGTTHEFWQTIHAGAKAAADEGDAEMLWKGPQKEDDRQQQIELVQNAIALGVDGIVLAPLDARALVGPVEQAVGKGIPVVIIDSALNSDAPVSYVATDNYNGGVLAARRMGELMGGEGRAILLRYAVGSASTEQREQGFLDTMASAFPGIEFVSKDQYAGATAATALEKSQQLVTRYRGQVDGIFAPNESSTFGMLRALEGVSIDLQPGEVHALIGENGAGKSTLMKVLSGACRPDSGSMTLLGEPYAPRGPREALARGVAMIYQELAIAPHLTVEANVMLGQERTSLGMVRRREHRRRVAGAMALLEHDDIRPEAVAGTLSVGAQQLVEVARALVGDARVIVFDEPTSSLTERDAERLFAVVGRLRDRGLAIVYISHFLEEVRRVAQRYTVLRDGRAVAGGMMGETTLDAIIAAMVGRDLTELFPRVPHEPGEPVLDLAGLSGRRLPRRVDLQLRRGEVLGIAGLIGAGRTELLRAVFGLDEVRSGRVTVKGVMGRSATPGGRIAQGIGLLSEDRKGEGLATGRSVEENLTLSGLGRYATLGWVALGRRRAATRQWIEAMRVRTIGPDQRVGALSGGNQQKVALARLLHQEADVLLLDEPTRGIDVGSKAEIYRRIGLLAAEGRAVLMVSSYLPELLGVCDRIAVMSRGVLGEARPVGEWTEHRIMEEATGQPAGA